jgi:aromatic-amino-acid transaminase
VVEVLLTLSPDEVADYAPIGGTPGYKEAIKKAAFGAQPVDAFVEVCATPGGTGAIRNTISNYSNPGDKILTSDWFWAPYGTIAQEIGRSIATFELFDKDYRFNLASFRSKVSELMDAQGSLVLLLNTPAHNPTGYSLTGEDWDNVLECLKAAAAKGPVALFVDVAYIDFAGEGEAARSFLPKLCGLPANLLPIIGFSLSKTFTMYGMRCGAALCMAATPEIAAEFKLVNEFSSRGTWSNSTKAGQVLMSKVFDDPALLERVQKEREGFRILLAARGKAFEDAVATAGLTCVPYDSGFFACIPCDDPAGLSEKLEAQGIFVVPLAKGIRISVASISEATCRKLPGLIAKVLK